MGTVVQHPVPGSWVCLQLFALAPNVEINTFLERLPGMYLIIPLG